ncbi:type VI immunity family protein [Gymnodinialimonas sp. 2305UL16-5]|uniref:type VI immunity family protein n=1 Tax=Gymnodinialimonas mytili TaxID=3126503 RepID=UPI003097E908
MGFTPPDHIIEGARQIDSDILRDPITGNPAARPVFSIVVFFPEGGTLDRQLAAVETLADLAAEMSDDLTHMQTADGNPEPLNLERFVSESRTAIQNRFENGREDAALDLDLGVFGEPFAVPANRGLCAFGGSVTAGAPIVDSDADMSRLEVTTSLSWDVETGFDRQIARTLRAAEALGASHGLAGFGLQYDRVAWGTADHHSAIPFLTRFPGFHCGFDGGFTTQATINRSQPDRYFSVNWLTILGDAMIDELGGEADLRRKLGEDNPFHTYRGGAVVQAGALPQTGDVNRGIAMDAYRTVSVATATVRFEDYNVGLFPNADAGESLRQTLAWAGRFDD